MERGRASFVRCLFASPGHSCSLGLVAAESTANDDRVELRGVTKTYGAVRALLGVTTTFRAGEVSMVLGANGSGKSTLLSIVGTLARPTSGKVSHGGLGKSREAVRRVLGWVGHDSLCYGDLSGRENVELAARLHGLDPRQAFEAARERFELGPFAERPFRTYSRGQRQKVALARALVHAPRLLLLDEPTTGLDAASVDRLRGVVKEEAARGAVVVVVTHDDGFASSVGDQRIVLERGRIAGS
ncbi:MAG: ABC transporter ATP-binding protein [Deltaproteobacteria bacterium]|nr:ABC transporter ATP-binding protein [Deltaproteobacteria bacterium]